FLIKLTMRSVFKCGLWLFILCGIMFQLSCKTKEKKPIIDYSALSDQQKRLPENAMASMEVAKGLLMNLFASEPMIANPTNMAIDAKGRIWVCEGRNYRPFVNPDNPY